jgi:hypothetical protein
LRPEGLAFLIRMHSGGCGAAGPALRSRIANCRWMIRLVGEWLLDEMKRTESEESSLHFAIPARKLLCTAVCKRSRSEHGD